MPAFMVWFNIKAIEHAKAYPDILNLEDLRYIKTLAQLDSSVTLFPCSGFLKELYKCFVPHTSKSIS